MAIERKDLITLKKINRIIERDSKDTTYKFALLRGVIDIVQEFPHYKEYKNNSVYFPLGLLVEKWLLYYYPIIESESFIPQKHGETINQSPGRKLSFRKYFNVLTNFYSSRGGKSVFFSELRIGCIPSDIQENLKNLCDTLRKTIIKMPMKYIGKSVNSSEYSIFQYEKKDYKRIKIGKISLNKLVENYGHFCFDREYYEIFEYMGSFLTGTDSLIISWAKFTTNADKNNSFNDADIISKLIDYPVEDRNVEDVKKVLFQIRKHENLSCVWSGKIINKLNIDHLIPFSVWKNNGLWNLLPTRQDINSKKGSKIPSPKLLDANKAQIIRYWEIFKSHYEKRFLDEIKIDLINSKKFDYNNWQINAFENLVSKSKYLIENRGFEEWNYNL